MHPSKNLAVSFVPMSRTISGYFPAPIDILKLQAVQETCKQFLPLIQSMHSQVMSDNMTTDFDVNKRESEIHLPLHGDSQNEELVYLAPDYPVSSTSPLDTQRCGRYLSPNHKWELHDSMYRMYSISRGSLTLDLFVSQQNRQWMHSLLLQSSRKSGLQQWCISSYLVRTTKVLLPTHPPLTSDSQEDCTKWGNDHSAAPRWPRQFFRWQTSSDVSTPIYQHLDLPKPFDSRQGQGQTSQSSSLHLTV